MRTRERGDYALKRLHHSFMHGLTKFRVCQIRARRPETTAKALPDDIGVVFTALSHGKLLPSHSGSPIGVFVRLTFGTEALLVERLLLEEGVEEELEEYDAQS